jgi:colanic acid biosynthesis glycosyl transferase WcaI
VLNIAPAFFSSILSLVGSILFKAKSWLHVQDFELDVAFDLGIFKMRKFRQACTSAERLILKRFDRLSTISHQMVKNLYHKRINESRIVLFPNWVDTKIIYPLNGHNPMREEFGISNDTIIALYSGNMGQKQGVEILAEVSRKLESHANIKFVFCGEGSARSRLYYMTTDLKNVTYLPLQPVDRLNNLLSLADIHLLPQRYDAADLVMPSKLAGIFASGRPVVATAVSGTEVAQVVKERGMIVRPNDAEEFAKSLLFLATNPGERKRLGNAGRSYAVEKLSKEKILCRFENDLCTLVNNRKGRS